MAAFGAVAFMLVAGWQFGISGTDSVFSEKELALENAVEGSGGPGTTCYDVYNNCWFYNCSTIYRCRPNGTCTTVSADDWSDSDSC